MKNTIHAVKVVNDRKPRKSKVKNPIKMEPTQRGFLRGEFKDANGQSCSLQRSSAFGGDGGELIWLGVNNNQGEFLVQGTSDESRVHAGGYGWIKKNLSEMYPGCRVSVPDRMHLSQEQVKALLPSLQYFAKYGELPK